ncbi:MAG: 2,3-bisphosphoglycerate-independent phosphoglycerate mutase [Acidobacteria bacterium]|nr:MAG: 2,3-bisphosphoglycerate-independent phosphoglycerate mutase [Acidobacteriota bacterium]
MKSSDTAIRPPTVLVIRDGWGHNPHPEHDRFNAVKQARTPVADRLAAAWPTTLIKTSGVDVGLPAGTMGNSEVGHQNLGAGRIVDQEIRRIDRAIEEGTFFDLPALSGAFEHARRTGGAVHLLGLVSDGKVHSDLAHLAALIEAARRRRWPAERLVVHAITDGRDTGPQSGLGYVEQLEAALAGAGRIATVVGRYWAMDRDHRWQRVARAYAALTGRSVAHPKLVEPVWITAASAAEAVRRYYDRPSTPSQSGDEFITPTRIGAGEGSSRGTIADGDAVIFFNFRGDRPREICKAFLLDDGAWRAVEGGGFDRGPRLDDLYFATMTRYEESLPVSAVLFDKPPKLEAILGEVIADAGLSQFRCAETEKYPHVTYFFNDYRDQPFPGEHRRLLPSPKEVGTYDQKPEMAAFAVRDAVLDRLRAADPEPLMVVNFANPDMVGHTGRHEAVVQAVEVVDACVGSLVDAALECGGSLIVTADHGNAEQTWDPENDCPHTAHTTYDVPLHLIATRHRSAVLRPGGRLADVAPTLLALMGLPQPAAMTGRCLLER